MQCAPGEKQFKSISWRAGCEFQGRYLGLHIGWRMPIEDVRNLVTGLVIRVGKASFPRGDRTVVLGFFSGLAEMEFWITGKPLGGRKSIDDPLGRGFVARVF